MVELLEFHLFGFLRGQRDLCWFVTKIRNKSPKSQGLKSKFDLHIGEVQKRECPAMRVGVPKEIKVQEYRVGLTPGAAREYVAAGHSVIVETNAGAGIGATDEVYRKAGAAIADTAAEIFASADMIVKVKGPQPANGRRWREARSISPNLLPAGARPKAKGRMPTGCR